MFKKIFLGSLLGLTVISFFTSIYRWFFSGWSNLLDGVPSQLDSSFYLVFLGYIVTSILLLLVETFSIWIFYKIILFFQKNKSNISRKYYFICSFFCIVILFIYYDFFAVFNTTGPKVEIPLWDIFIKISLFIIVPLFLSIFYFFLKRYKDNLG